MFALLFFAGCANSDKPAAPEPDKPKTAAVEATSEAKAVDAKPTEDKPVADKPADKEKPTAEATPSALVAPSAAPELKELAPKAAETKPSEPAAKVAGDAPKPEAESKTAVAKPTKIDARNGILGKGAADKIVKAGARPVIRLLDAGAEPREVASFALAKGTMKPLQMAMDLEMAMEAGGMKLPPTSMPQMVLLFDFSTGERSGSDWPIDGKLKKLSVEPKGAAQSQMAEALRPQLGALEGMGMNYFIDEKGRVRDVKVTLPPSMPAGAGQMMSGMTQSIESMTAPLPNEAIGAGAKWEVLARIAANGADLLQVSTFTLAKRDGDSLTIDIAVKQFAAKDSVSPPGMPPETKAKLSSFKSSGSGKSVLDIKDIAPKSGSVSVDTAMSIEIQITEGGETEKQNTSVNTKMTASYSRPNP